MSNKPTFSEVSVEMADIPSKFSTKRVRGFASNVTPYYFIALLVIQFVIRISMGAQFDTVANECFSQSACVYANLSGEFGYPLTTVVKINQFSYLARRLRGDFNAGKFEPCLIFTLASRAGRVGIYPASDQHAVVMRVGDTVAIPMRRSKPNVKHLGSGANADLSDERSAHPLYEFLACDCEDKIQATASLAPAAIRIDQPPHKVRQKIARHSRDWQAVRLMRHQPELADQFGPQALGVNAQCSAALSALQDARIAANDRLTFVQHIVIARKDSEVRSTLIQTAVAKYQAKQPSSLGREWAERETSRSFVHVLIVPWPRQDNNG